jgi:two-component system, NtrC family, nitrogen regulation response regulator NtrX
VERLIIMVPGERVTEDDLMFLSQGAVTGPRLPLLAEPLAPLHYARDQFEKEYILRALAAQHGNISRTAEVLGVERSNLYRKMRSFGIGPARKPEDEVEA